MIRRRVALSIGVLAQTPEAEESHLDALEELPEVGLRVHAVTDTLVKLGYDCAPMVGAYSAAEIGGAVRGAMQSLDSDDVLIVHVYSHGITSNDALYVVGADGRHHSESNVEWWLRQVSDHEPPSGPHTLLLLDLCHAGLAARLHWQARQSDERTRAWVIAACGPRQRAFEGRFSDAVAEVLLKLTDGRLDLDQSVPYAPLETMAREIRREVTRRGGRAGALGQRVTANRVDISSPPPQLPFFPNRAYATGHRQQVRNRVDIALLPFLDDVDEALDAGHFLSRAAGYGVLATDRLIGCFSGRSRELRFLVPWIDIPGGTGLCVVTGGPGAGKSALIGLLVCAAHPELREPTREVWEHAERAPYPNHHMAAISARERSLSQVVTSVARQLKLLPDVRNPSVGEVVSAVAAMPDAPLIIIDGLDEAPDKLAIMDEFLLPLSRVTRPDGILVRILVGTRPLPEFGPLFVAADSDSGFVLDLDQVEPRRLRADVRGYVYNLLVTDQRWDQGDYVGHAQQIAWEVADALIGDAVNREWGAFLVAGLFAAHILSTYDEPIGDKDAAKQLGRSVPRTLPELLDLDLRTRAAGPWVQPVLVALAHAKGDGMPVRILAHVAAAIAGNPAPEAEDILAALDTIRFYLRISAEVDGATLYRLFHQGLADHLQQQCEVRTVWAGLLNALADRLVGGDASAVRYWEIAEPYLLRHAATHAVLADRLPELMADIGYLMAADPSVVLAEAEALSPSDAAKLELLGIYRTVSDLPTGDAARRRQALALAAVRGNQTQYLRQILDVPGAHVFWQPAWIHTDTTGRTVTAVATAVDEGGSYAALGTGDGSIALRDLRTGLLLGLEQSVHEGAVTGLCIGDVGARKVVVSAGADGILLVHPLTGKHAHRPVPVSDQNRVLTLGRMAGWHSVAAVGDAGTGGIWDLDTGTRLATMDFVAELAECFSVDDEPARIVRLADEPEEAVIYYRGVEGPRLRHDAPVMSAAAGLVNDALVFFTGDTDGKVRAWDIHGAIMDEMDVAAPVEGLHASEQGDLLVRMGNETLAFRIEAPTPPTGSTRRILTGVLVPASSFTVDDATFLLDESLRWGLGPTSTRIPKPVGPQVGSSFAIISAGLSGAGPATEEAPAWYAGATMFAVGDGRVSVSGAETTSRAVVDAMAGLERAAPRDLEQHLRGAIEAANGALLRAVRKDAALNGAAVTVGALIFSANKVGVVHVGDVRVYRLRGGQLTQLTRDETEAQRLVDERRISPEFVYANDGRWTPSRVLNGQPIEAACSVHEVSAGDRYLICSSGVWGTCSRTDVLRALKKPGSPGQAAAMLVPSSEGRTRSSAVIVVDVAARESRSR
ncbi:caspase family protein [Micromonospora sp. STR1s_5]|nr:caspase family protein [Micromonospora sp. STR1s_5]